METPEIPAVVPPPPPEDVPVVHQTHPVTRLQRLRVRVLVALSSTGPRVRRAIDLVVSGLALLVLAPLLVGTAAAIKLTSRGPVFYRQERVGHRGRRFGMYKFRTMVVGADALKTELARLHPEALTGVRFKLADDPRITRIGAVLRKFSIDELPQLWNVLRGDMTLVGPRPPVWREVELYGPLALRRLEVRPGLTCLWQVGGRSEVPFDKQVELDIEYIDTVTPADEIKIVARTIPAVIKGKGAY